MDKRWPEIVKNRIKNYNFRKREIENTLEILLNQLKNAPYNIYTKQNLVDDKYLIWEAMIGKQKITVSEEEISKKQIIMKTNDNELLTEIHHRRSIKEVLEEIITEKLI
ncbi:hypothetical protein [Senegalia massiliensis]|uniref:hypothetical protein n=1 Tax=Senegalia massiliensis TaxID=1720316 RepID=UPI0010314BFD|nr:hypothetical protein [Senegalia massiliensis]